MEEKGFEQARKKPDANIRLFLGRNIWRERRSALRAAERALEVFRRVGVMAGNILGVVAVECAIDRGVVRLAGEFVAVNRGIKRARYEIAA